MSTSVATAVATLAQTWSLGPVKVQVFDVPLVSGDTAVTVTGDRMIRAIFGLLAVGVTQTAVPTYSGATATFTITDPAATIKGQVILLGV
jgi:hypothetical protein